MAMLPVVKIYSDRYDDGDFENVVIPLTEAGSVGKLFRNGSCKEYHFP
jgi:hypothetical protein